MEEKNYLKLNLKKDVYETIVNGATSLTFEMTPFYFSKFTDSKHNTIDDLKNDANHFKNFDGVIFTCAGGEPIEFDTVLGIGFTNSETPEFILDFSPFLLEYDEPVEVDVEKFIEPETSDKLNEDTTVDLSELEFTDVDDVKSEHVPEEDIEVEDTTDIKVSTDTDKIIEDFYNNEKVYIVNRLNITVAPMGRVFGCKKYLPCSNEHPHSLSFEKVIIKNDANEISDKFVKILKSDFVFVNPSKTEITEDGFVFYIKTLNRQTLLNWF